MVEIYGEVYPPEQQDSSFPLVRIAGQTLVLVSHTFINHPPIHSLPNSQPKHTAPNLGTPHFNQHNSFVFTQLVERAALSFILSFKPDSVVLSKPSSWLHSIADGPTASAAARPRSSSSKHPDGAAEGISNIQPTTKYLPQLLILEYSRSSICTTPVQQDQSRPPCSRHLAFFKCPDPPSLPSKNVLRARS